MTADDVAAQIGEALGVLLQRRFRSQLSASLTDGLHEAVDPASYPVLSGVARLGPISAAALGQQVGLDRSIVSRRAAALVAAGLLVGRPDPRDARATLLSLSPAGSWVVATLRHRLAAAIEQHLAEWDPADRRQFAILLGRFVAPGRL